MTQSFLHLLFKHHLLHFLFRVLMWLYLHLDLIDIIFEVSFFHCTIWERHLAIPMLNTSVPFTLIPAAICPPHLAIPMAIVFFVLTLVLVTTSPDEPSKAMLAVILILAVIDVARGALGAAPLAFSVFHASLEQTNIGSSVGPRILSLAFRLSIQIVTSI